MYNNKDTENERSLITIRIKNKGGVLAKIANYCSEHNMNIEKLVVSNFRIDNKEQKIVMYVTGDRKRVGLLLEGIKTIEEVISVYNFQSNDYLERELVIIKVNLNNPTLPRIVDLINEYQGQTIYVKGDIMIFQVTNNEESNNELTEKIEKMTNETEILKSGMIATSLDKVEI